MGDYIVNDDPGITLNINGKKRYAEAVWNPKTQQYLTLLPAEELIDRSSPANGDAPDVQGHLATFDKDGKLLGVEALGWGPEGGFYGTKWPTTADSIYNANAAKTYSTQVFKQVKRQENGGNMNYSQYLQEGGAAPQQGGQNAQQQIIALVQAAMSGDKNAADQINQIMQAAQQGDQQATQIAQLIQEVAQQMQGGAEAMKCGGKVKAKVKKKEVGGFVRKAGTGCACQLKKVGGRLIEVDGCTGLPVKKNGGIMKFETPAQGITYTNIPNSLYAIGSDGQLYQKTSFNGNTYYSTPIPYNENSRKNINTRDYFRGYGHTYNGMYFNPGLRKFVPASQKFFKARNGNTKVIVNERGDIFYDNGRYYNQLTGKMESYAPDEIEGGWDSYWGDESTQNTQENTQATTQSTTTQNPEAASVTTRSGAASATPEVPAAVQAWRNNFGAGKSGKFGGLTYDEALARQREMAAAEGFNAELGEQDGKWGDKSKREWERYQTWKAEKEAAANRSAAGAGNETAVDPATVRTVKTTPYMQNTKTNFQNSSNMTNQQLLDLNAAQALTTLDRAGYNRWMQLNAAKQHDTYVSGTYSAPMAVGDIYYNDEQSFNNARDAENLAVREQQLEALQNAKTNKQRRKINADYGKKINTATWNPRTYTINPTLNQDVLSATTFTPAQCNGGMLNYQNYFL